MPPPPHTLENKLYYVRMILLLTDLDFFFEITTTQMVICKQPLVSLHFSLARVESVCAIVNISHHHNSANAAAGSSSSVGGDGDRSAINWSLQTVMLLLTMVAS